MLPLHVRQFLHPTSHYFHPLWNYRVNSANPCSSLPYVYLRYGLFPNGYYLSDIPKVESLSVYTGIYMIIWYSALWPLVRFAELPGAGNQVLLYFSIGMSPSRNPPQKWFGFKGGRPRRRVLHVGTNSLEARGGSWTSRLCSSLTNPNCHILTETYGITSSKPYPHSQNVVPLYLRAMVAQLRESIWLALRFSLWIARGLPSALRRVMMTYHLLAFCLLEQNLMS